jgi:hypothetical protein
MSFQDVLGGSLLFSFEPALIFLLKATAVLASPNTRIMKG